MGLRWRSDGRCEMEEQGGYFVIPMMHVLGIFYGLVVKYHDQTSREMIRIGMATILGRTVTWPGGKP
jgi:hypothetical protein